jgi:hypothetical protein
MRSPWILGHCREKRVMMHILIELLLRHRFNHELNVWSKSTRSERVGGYVPYLIHNVLKDVEAHRLHESHNVLKDSSHPAMECRRHHPRLHEDGRGPGQ